MKSAFDIGGLAQHLVKLRTEGRQALTAEFAAPPPNIESAMETQDRVSELEGIESHAWKVAASPDNDFVVAPLHPFLESASRRILIWRPGMKLEVEIAVKLGKDLPVLLEGTYSRDAIAEAVCEIFLGVELVWSAVGDGGSVSYPLFLADRLGNMGYVLGPSLSASTLESFTGMPLYVSLNKKALYDAGAQHPTGDLLTWLLGYTNDTTRPQASLREGSVITTGSLCGAFEITEPGHINVRLNSDVSFDFLLSAEP
ncbi:2-keto-4-pentenoate hydratase (plasmid) [Agrobacterium tumefaciens]|nr:2-keto-4-pentenoate hydratase [Agrobacterium tumefaciens]NSZ25587.1 2-keto-4-pentenoate hydratase [Agrobacterium tumefaciens]NTB21676.1 2-keto-4-pentenoate hydratase [Agrobacterium tumefaciens]QQE32388.1 2-keto-4-pentenoate hydratase [Agrobacterium tumefaciens]